MIQLPTGKISRDTAGGAFLIAFFFTAAFLLFCDRSSSNEKTNAYINPSSGRQEIRNYKYRVIREYPHDIRAFTQGLVYADGVFYEGTGQKGESQLRKVEVESGTVLKRLDLADQYFGEGITIMGDKIYQLTYLSKTGFVYDINSFELLDTFRYPTQGWGLTHDGERLIKSDGSSYLSFLDPKTFEPVGQIQVLDNNRPVRRLNELEYINGTVYANIWVTNFIIRINPYTGSVIGRIDLGGLLRPDQITMNTDVLNGIAYDMEQNRLFVTGKYWPSLFEIELQADVTYHFTTEGLHLISLPVRTESSSVSELFPVARGKFAYEWLSGQNRYEPVTEIKPGKGYWIDIETPGSVTLSGIPVDCIKTEIEPGWFLTGAPEISSTFLVTKPKNSVAREFWSYDPQDKTYYRTGVMQETNGYWIHIDSPGQLAIYGVSWGSSDSRKIAAPGDSDLPPAPPALP